MDKFQVYNRELNTWVDDNIELMPSWSENWVLDKTTDSANIKLKYKGLNVPNWKKGDWCRILHLEGEDVGATYESKPIIEKVSPNDIVKEQCFPIEDPAYLPEGVNIATDIKYSIKTEYNFDGAITVSAQWLFDNEGLVSISGVVTKNEPLVYRVYDEEVGGGESQQVNYYPTEVNVYRSSVSVPKNHEQYLIKDISTIIDNVNNEIDIQLTLEEPIEMANGINCETMPFTNQISKVVDGVTYNHEPQTHLSVLDKILRVTPANNDDYNNQTRQQRKGWLNRIAIVDRSLLESLPFNDETFNESTLYEILLNKYDSSVGRTPVMYFDMNAETDLPYNTERSEYLLVFERQDGLDKESVDYDDLVANSNQITQNKSSENFADGIISNYDNLSPNNNIYTPAEVLWLIPEGNTDNRSLTNYTGTGTGDWILKLPHNIKKVNSVKRYYLSVVTTFAGGIESVEDVVEDFSKKVVNNAQTNLVFEEKQYKANDTYFQNANCVWYTEGTNLIHLNEVFYKEMELSGRKNIWIYQVEYEPLVSGRFDLGKDYQIQINQVSSQIDSEKFSKYLKDYFNSMNKADLTIVKTVDKFSDIVEIGTRVVKNNKNYIITNVSIQNRGFEYDIVYQLNENHTRKNDSIEAPKEIRKNIEIAIDATKERKSMLAKNIKLSLNSQTSGNDDIIRRDYVFSTLFETYNLDHYPQLAYLTFKSDFPFVSSGTNQINLISEICRYSINDTMCFNFKFLDNAEAGKEKQLQKRSSVGVDVPYYYAVPNYQTPILYTDIFGEFNTFDVKLIKTNNVDLATYESGSTTEEMTDYLNTVYPIILSVTSYPLTTGISQQDINSPISSVSGINYYKDMLDTFNYTLGFHIETDDNIIIGDSLLKNNVLMTKDKKQIKYIQIRSKNLNLQDYEEDKWGYTTKEITSAVYDFNGKFTISFPEVQTPKSMLLLDEDRNPLLIINDFDKVFAGISRVDEINLYC